MNLNTTRRILLPAVMMIAAAVPLAADAQSRGHSGGGGHGGYSHYGGGGWHGGGYGWWGWGLGLGLGVAYLANPYLYAPYPGYYYPYGQPTVIVDQGVAPQANVAMAPSAAPAAGSWYFCDSAKAYYPYVAQCPEPWRMVPAVPPGAVR